MATAVVSLTLLASPTATGDSASPDTYQGRTAKAWHDVALHRLHQRDHARAKAGQAIRHGRRMRRELAGMRHIRLHQPDSLEAIRLAAIAYHVDYQLLRDIAACESHLYRYAKNRHSTASGLFQFLTGTFAGTPYGAESIWSPYANALAAGWMISQGRRGEWVC